jgi:hypothetical protein
MSKILMAVILVLMATVPMYGQNEGCILDAAKDGDIIKVQGKLLPADFRLFPKTCPQDTEHSIWVTSEGYSNLKARIGKSLSDFFKQQGYNRSLEEPMPPLKRDKVFLEFERLRKEELPEVEGVYCIGCHKYEITEVEFEGELLILPYPEDLEPGLSIIEGVGAVTFITRYWLIYTSILSFEAKEMERINPPLIKYYEDGLPFSEDIVPTGKIIRIDSRTETEQYSN